MFDYPLPLTSNTEYDRLEIEPTATDEEIKAALTRLKKDLRQQQRQSQERIDKVMQVVPGLEEAYKTRDELRDADKHVSKEELASANATVTKLEQQALELEPEFRQMRERIQELQGMIEKANISPLRNLESQLDYDRSVPPLDLLKLADCSHSGLSDNRTVLVLLRRELSAFLAAQGEVVFHPSDLTRTDFVSDFEPIDKLDGGQ